MKCQRCGNEMRNTIGGNYTCDECGFSINDLVYRGGRGWKDYTIVGLDNLTDKQNTATTTTEGLATQSTATKSILPDGMIGINNQGYFVRQGWQCPKCGAILSPDTSFCPFCTRQTFTPTVTCSTSGEYINPNVTTSISKEK